MVARNQARRHARTRLAVTCPEGGASTSSTCVTMMPGRCVPGTSLRPIRPHRGRKYINTIGPYRGCPIWSVSGGFGSYRGFVGGKPLRRRAPGPVPSDLRTTRDPRRRPSGYCPIRTEDAGRAAPDATFACPSASPQTDPARTSAARTRAGGLDDPATLMTGSHDSAGPRDRRGRPPGPPPGAAYERTDRAAPARIRSVRSARVFA